MYSLGTKSGILEGAYSINQFEVCKQNFLNLTEVPIEKVITLREAAGLASVAGTSQGFVKCSCRKTCAAKCKCVMKGMLCNSICHSKRTCNNNFD